MVAWPAPGCGPLDVKNSSDGSSPSPAAITAITSAPSSSHAPIMTAGTGASGTVSTKAGLPRKGSVAKVTTWWSSARTGS
jgi:hypothetical protein